jgi:pilus assembly protein CpaE
LTQVTTAQTVRVLLVSTREAARDEIENVLSTWPADSRLYWVAQPNLAPARAAELVPHAILIDDDLGGAHMVPLIRDLAARVPSAAVLALVDDEAMDQARQAVLAGARSFLTKPLRADEVIATLQQALGPRGGAPAEAGAATDEAAGRIVVFCAPKGGTGRTTLAINTAVSLYAATKQPVVLVDADYAAPALDVALNVHTERNVTDLLPRLSRLDEELIAGVLAPHASGIQVLLAPPPADLTHPISLPQVQYLSVLLKHMFPWVVVDLGLPLDETAFAFLDSADLIVMSVLPEMVGLRNTRLMLDQLYDRGYAQDRVWLVVNRATLKGGVSTADIEARLRMKVTYSIPDDQPLATYSINRGVPLVMSHRRSAVARSVGTLAARLVDSLAPRDSAVTDTRPARSRPGLRLLRANK